MSLVDILHKRAWLGVVVGGAPSLNYGLTVYSVALFFTGLKCCVDGYSNSETPFTSVWVAV
jgi:hypothetical protein